MTQTTRLLWLTYERNPHPDAVVSPASEEDVRLVLGVMDYPRQRRAQLFERLKSVFSKISEIPAHERPRLPARMENGLYRLISWRLALWLSHVVFFEGSQKDQLTSALRTWLESGADGEIFSVCCATHPL